MSSRIAARMSVFVVVLCAVVAPLMTVAASDRVVVTRESLDIVSVDTESCAFPIEFHEQGKQVVHEFYDREGMLTKALITYPEFKVTVTNLETGASLTFAAPASFTFDFVKGTFTATGNQSVITIPHLGLIAQDAGRIVFPLDGFEPIFVAGTHDFFLPEEGTEPAFCAALADGGS